MNIQRNWVCKAQFPIRRNMSLSNIEEIKIPAGHLRAVSFQCFPGGTSARSVGFRIPLAGIDPLSFCWAIAGFADWVALYTYGGHRDRGVFLIDVVSMKAAIDVMIFGCTEADNNPIQLGFWYEPDELDPFYVSVRPPLESWPPTVDDGGES